MGKTISRGGTLGSTRRPPNEARANILAAAERLFYNEGIGAVGVDAVAEAARVTKRTLYYHFASKEELIAAYLDARDETTLNALRAASSDTAAHPGDRILGVFDFVQRWAATADYHGCPFNNAVAEQSMGPKVTAIARRHKATVKSWFSQQAAEAGVRDKDVVGAQLLVLLDGALNGAAVSGSPEAAAVARAMAETVLKAAGVAHAGRSMLRKRQTHKAKM